jgi:parallel beta helix pectate lyase-like protein
MTRRRSLVLCLLAMLPALATTLPISVRADDDGKKEKVSVRCGKGKTIGDVLTERRGPLTIELVGTCFEHVKVASNDVTLQAGTPGSGIQGTDSTKDTLTVTADRFVLDGLHVTGGRNAIVVTGSQAQLRNCTTLSAGSGILSGIGILFSQGASGSVDNCESSSNPADGIFLDGAVVTITNSRFVSNNRVGVFVFGGSTGRIGFTSALLPAGNTISKNAGNGIQVALGSMGLIYGNTVTGNGTNPTSPLGRFGIFVLHSRVDLPGKNMITGNFWSGMGISGSTAIIGDPGFNQPTDNVIRGNNLAALQNQGGVSLALGSAAVLRNATIDANNGAGVALSERSTAVLFSANVTNNTANGVQLIQGSGIVFRPNAPLSVISGNTGFDLKCFDTESSITTGYAGSPTIDGCTAF